MSSGASLDGARGPVRSAAQADAVIEALQNPAHLWSRDEVLRRPSPVPAKPGICGWHFTEPLAEGLAVDRLLYVGIAPRHMRGRPSTQNLRTRISYHYRGNADGSTLRLTLGCLLGFELRRVGSGKRMTFGADGERDLSEWMADHARVCYVLVEQPWEIKADVIARTDVPLNLDQNHDHAFHASLSQIRADAKARARVLPVLGS